jgi:NAD-dependent dihydropyrimidine dehydrogenase PreA subunit
MEAVQYNDRACRFVARLQQDDYLRLDEIIRRYRDKPGYLIPALKDAQALFGFLPMEVVLSAIRYFRNEYEAHIHEKRCPALMCPALIRFRVREEACKMCGLCFKACPAQAMRWEKKQPAVIDRSACTRCRSCIRACKYGAIE